MTSGSLVTNKMFAIASAASAMFCFTLIACASTGATKSPKNASAISLNQADSVLVLENGQKLSGEVHCDGLVILPGVEVIVHADLNLFSSGLINIQGTLRAANRDFPAVINDLYHTKYDPDAVTPPLDAATKVQLMAQMHAPNIKLVSASGIYLGPSGLIVGGNSASYPDHKLMQDPLTGAHWHLFSGMPGVEGGCITIESPNTIVDGQLRGGDGGIGGPGSKGGKGGSLYEIGGVFITQAAAHPYASIGGTGGVCLASFPSETQNGVYYPALPAGSGGDGGDVLVFENPFQGYYSQPVDEFGNWLHSAVSHSALLAVAGFDPMPSPACGDNGIDGMTGGNAQGGTGIGGMPGAPGSQSAPVGGTGGVGGRGGDGMATAGRKGGKAPDCCGQEGTPGIGGKGGPGGDGTGGMGGTGGPGGPAYFSDGSYLAPGGLGGQGGPGGDGKGGPGNEGGQGGDGTPAVGAGGPGGDGGKGYKGDGGSGGPGGPGSSPGSQGPVGGLGGTVVGSPGANGPVGNFCDSQTP